MLALPAPYRVTARCTCRLAWLQRQAEIAELAR
jgi:hypothetical protein